MSRKYSRLAKYDRRAALLARLTHGLSYAHWYAISGILLLFLLTGGALLFGTEAGTISSIASSTIGIAATLGGLSTTIFFLTAQLKVGGISQYGLTELYRVRDHLPLMLTTISAILLGFLSLITAPCDGVGLAKCASGPTVLWIDPIVFDPHRQFAMLAILAVGLLMFMSIVLGLTLISNLEPVTVARRYAMRVESGDALEWGLFTVTFRPEAGRKAEIAKYQLVSNRRNFGLRDPIMPIHELVLVAPNQRFGQLLGVMLARVTKEYGMHWTAQAPDVDTWAFEPSKFSARGLERSAMSERSVERARDRVRNRFSLAILMLHYVRRIPGNDDCQAARDARRQAAQFQLCRLIVTVANKEGASGPSDIDDVIDLALNAILHISVDAKDLAPHGKSESLWALAATARVLNDAHRIVQASSAIDILSWSAVNTMHISGDRRGAVIENLSKGSSQLAKNFEERQASFKERGGRGKLPSIGKCDPWLEAAGSSQK